MRKAGDTDPLKQYVWNEQYIDAPAIRYYDADTDGANIVTHDYANDANMCMALDDGRKGEIVVNPPIDQRPLSFIGSGPPCKARAEPNVPASDASWR